MSLTNEEYALLKEKVLKRFKSNDDISIPLIQRRCLLGYFASQEVLMKLEEEKYIIKNGKIFKMK